MVSGKVGRRKSLSAPAANCGVRPRDAGCIILFIAGASKQSLAAYGIAAKRQIVVPFATPGPAAVQVDRGNSSGPGQRQRAGAHMPQLDDQPGSTLPLGGATSACNRRR